MRFTSFLLSFWLLCFASFSVQAQVAQDRPSADRLSSPLGDLISKAQTLSDTKRAAEAFKLLKASEDSYAGNIDFDYALGLAANDAQEPGQAILALERVLLVRPDFLQARAELARAYALAKETENAKREFQALREQPIPPEVKRTIDQYLNALQGKTDNAKASSTNQNQSQQTKTSLNFESFIGRDSNVNFGTALDQWVPSPRKATVNQKNHGFTAQILVQLGRFRLAVI
jgi:outer membrane protein